MYLHPARRGLKTRILVFTLIVAKRTHCRDEDSISIMKAQWVDISTNLALDVQTDN